MGQGDHVANGAAAAEKVNEANEDKVVNFEGDENEERGNWTGRFDFILSAIGFAVGLGNVWRFPYKAAQNGGASFLIPYVIMLLLAGLPLFFMEMAFGQFASLGPISVWRAVPIFKGLGYAMVIISALVCVYYNMIIAYTLYYFFASLNTEVPWQNCKEEWKDLYNCVDRLPTNESMAREEWCTTMGNTTFSNDTLDFGNHTDFMNYTKWCLTAKASPSLVYWEREVLEMSEAIDVGASEISYKLALCFLLAWIIIFACLCKGIKSSGKVVYVTATFPYIVLVILLIRNATLDGAVEGIKFYMIPDWDRLMDYKVWYQAAVQIFYSLGVAFGSLGTMASYNRFNNNVYRDTLIVAILNCATSVFAGFVIFSVTGYMAVKTGQSVEAVADIGPGLAFIAYPEGLAMMPIAPLWSVLFFIMLFMLGLDSQFAMMETVISALHDEFPFFQKGNRKSVLTFFLCVGLFFIGLPQCAKNGIYIMNLFDWYSAGFSLFIVSLLEVTAISWVYGLKQFNRDIEMMLGFKPNIYWQATWLVITPLLLLGLLIASVVEYGPASYNGYIYPAWADGIGWGMVGIALIWIPVIGFVEYCKAHGVIETLKKVFHPAPEWGPYLDKHRTGEYNNAFELEEGMRI